MAQPTGGYHRPVLLEQTLQALHIRPDGIYLDGTAGRRRSFPRHCRAADHRPPDRAGSGSGCHCRSRRTAAGAAGDGCTGQFCADGRGAGRAGDPGGGRHFAGYRRFLPPAGCAGARFFLSLRCPVGYADEPERRNGRPGCLARLSERELAEIFYRYGEEKFSRPIARAIVRQRDRQPIETTLQLAELVSANVPAAAAATGTRPAGCSRRCALRSMANWIACPQRGYRL